MKKNELVHLHALLVRVARDVTERGDAEQEAFEPYDALGVTPMSLRESRARHEEAVRTLATILAELSADATAAVRDGAPAPVDADGGTGSTSTEPAPSPSVEAASRAGTDRPGRTTPTSR